MPKPDTFVQTPWIPLTTSLSFLARNKILLAWSVGLTAMTILFTWFGFILSTDFIDSLTGSFLSSEPIHDSLVGWIKYGGWKIASYLFLFISRIISFFVSFLLAYTISSPFYAFLSSAAEKRYLGKEFTDDAFTVSGMCRDFYEGVKIALFGMALTIVAIAIGFVPLIGQIAVIFLYTCYSTLMFIDYPASRRRWSLGAKINWLFHHFRSTIKLGWFPACISMIPIINIVIMACLFPLFTVHATINFAAVEHSDSRKR